MSKHTMRINVHFQNYFYYANQVITILTIRYLQSRATFSLEPNI